MKWGQALLCFAAFLLAIYSIALICKSHADDDEGRVWQFFVPRAAVRDASSRKVAPSEAARLVSPDLTQPEQQELPQVIIIQQSQYLTPAKNQNKNSPFLDKLKQMNDAIEKRIEEKEKQQTVPQFPIQAQQHNHPQAPQFPQAVMFRNNPSLANNHFLRGGMANQAPEMRFNMERNGMPFPQPQQVKIVPLQGNPMVANNPFLNKFINTMRVQQQMRNNQTPQIQHAKVTVRVPQSLLTHPYLGKFIDTVKEKMTQEIRNNIMRIPSKNMNEKELRVKIGCTSNSPQRILQGILPHVTPVCRCRMTPPCCCCVTAQSRPDRQKKFVKIETHTCKHHTPEAHSQSSPQGCTCMYQSHTIQPVMMGQQPLCPFREPQGSFQSCPCMHMPQSHAMEALVRPAMMAHPFFEFEGPFQGFSHHHQFPAREIQPFMMGQQPLHPFSEAQRPHQGCQCMQPHGREALNRPAPMMGHPFSESQMRGPQMPHIPSIHQPQFHVWETPIGPSPHEAQQHHAALSKPVNRLNMIPAAHEREQNPTIPALPRRNHKEELTHPSERASSRSASHEAKRPWQHDKTSRLPEMDNSLHPIQEPAVKSNSDHHHHHAHAADKTKAKPVHNHSIKKIKEHKQKKTEISSLHPIQEPAVKSNSPTSDHQHDAHAADETKVKPVHDHTIKKIKEHEQKKTEIVAAVKQDSIPPQSQFMKLLKKIKMMREMRKNPTIPMVDASPSHEPEVVKKSEATMSTSEEKAVSNPEDIKKSLEHSISGPVVLPSKEPEVKLEESLTSDPEPLTGEPEVVEQAVSSMSVSEAVSAGPQSPPRESEESPVDNPVEEVLIL